MLRARGTRSYAAEDMHIPYRHPVQADLYLIGVKFLQATDEYSHGLKTTDIRPGVHQFDVSGREGTSFMDVQKAPGSKQSIAPWLI